MKLKYSYAGKTPKFFFAFSLIFFAAVFVKALPGDLDPSFGSGGKVITDINNTGDEGRSAAVQPDGKIVIGGSSEISANAFDFSLIRYNANGSLDTTFGTNGKVLTTLSGWQKLFAVALQPDGKIIAVGEGDGGASFATAQIHRYNFDGTLDQTFGTNGIINSVIGVSSAFYDVAVQPDGKIVAVGFMSPGNTQRFLAARYNSNGSLDNSFSGDGIYFSDFIGTIQVSANAVALQTDGKIILGGSSSQNFGYWIRLNQDGSPEGNPSLLGIGLAVKDVSLQADGKILFAGTYNASNEPNANNIGISRRNADKSADASFGISSGSNFANFGADSFGNSLIIQNDGRIVVGGYVNSTTKDFALARFNSNGLLDVGFGNQGRVTTAIGSGDDQINSLALQPDGKYVAAGSSASGTLRDYAAARYLGGSSATVPNSTPFDFDGDGRADTTVFRGGVWYILQSLDNSFKTISFGQSTDKIVPADYDGDGRTDAAVFRPSNATWYILRSSDNGFTALQYGTSDSLPRPGDFDGDGKADIAVFYPLNGTWYIRESGLNSNRVVKFGTNGDTPLIADFDGDGKDDLAVFRQSEGVWYWTRSSDNGFRSAQFGTNGDLPAAADYDGDGKTDLAVFRPSNGTWYQLRSTQGFSAVNFGVGADRPVPADYDGDGKTDITVFRGGIWYELRSSNNGFSAVSWGQNGDASIPSAFIP